MEESLWSFRRECNIQSALAEDERNQKKGKRKKKMPGSEKEEKCRDLCNTET